MIPASKINAIKIMIPAWAYFIHEGHTPTNETLLAPTPSVFGIPLLYSSFILSNTFSTWLRRTLNHSPHLKVYFTLNETVWGERPSKTV